LRFSWKGDNQLAETYDYRNCQSLFGYALDIHKRHNCVCQLCGCGGNKATDFDIWRQMSVEHLIGKSQGGYKAEIRASIDERFPALSEAEREAFAERLNEANTVSACRFCNSTTSRDRYRKNMRDFIFEAQGDPESVINQVIDDIDKVLQKKQQKAKCKIDAVRIAFYEKVVGTPP
jgi:hypothetical protein